MEDQSLEVKNEGYIELLLEDDEYNRDYSWIIRGGEEGRSFVVWFDWMVLLVFCYGVLLVSILCFLWRF